MKTKKKMKFNSDKAFTNLVLLTNVITIGFFIHKIATNGIAWMSTTGLLG